MGLQHIKSDNAYAAVVYIGNKKYSCAYSYNKYGKYAKLMAEYSLNNLDEDGKPIKINNWYEETDNHAICIYSYNKKLNRYFKIFIDKDDFNKVKEKYWYVQEYGNTFYACSHISKDKWIFLHCFIMNDILIDHINGNGLDNRRINLRKVNDSINGRNRHHSKKNRTGFIGTHYREDIDAYVATWRDENYKHRTKTFTVKKYGKEKAFELAKEYRLKMMEKYGYNINEAYSDAEDE